jgi:quinoprotein glucose dehydrogenase
VVAAAGLLVAGLLLLLGRPTGLLVYALVIAGSLGWAIYEVGFDWWQLAPRGGLLIVLGLLLLTPWVRRPLARRSGKVWGLSALALVAAILASVAVAVYSMTIDVHQITGTVPEAEAATLPPSEATVVPAEWHAYGRTPGGSHYSPLTAITPENVAGLQKVWEYHTGDVRVEDDPEETTYEVTPTLVDGLLYLCTPHQIAIALDPLTGREVWRYDPQVGVNKQRQHQTCRGLSYVVVEGATAGSACASRVLLPTADARLIALDAKTGSVCTGFGDNGAVNLALNMPNFYPGSYYSTSPPVSSSSAGLSTTMSRPPSRPASSAPSTPRRARWSGISTAAIPTRQRRSRPDCLMSATRPMPGRCSASTSS